MELQIRCTSCTKHINCTQSDPAYIMEWCGITYTAIHYCEPCKEELIKNDPEWNVMARIPIKKVKPS